jgi:electron transfer flavoprotein alpha subunit
MSILILAEHDNQSIKPATLNAIAAAQKIGGDIHVPVMDAQVLLPQQPKRQAYPRCWWLTPHH